MANNTNCPPAPLPVLIPQSIIDVLNDPNVREDDCIQLNATIHSNYTSENIENYLNSLREQFIREYINQAITNVVETFTEKHTDREYQYTLYYYDQAGNLIQTVAPEGVKRIINPNNDAINAYRQNSPTGEAFTSNGVILTPEHNFKTQYKYNSLNQLVWQSTPDGGITRFAYDDLGRIISSQNAKQLAHINNGNYDFSYTKYDDLGRIIEAGQVQLATTFSISDEGRLINNTNTPVTLETAIADATSIGSKEDVSLTIYDKPLPGTIHYFENFNDDSRNRVTAVLYFNELTASTNTVTGYNNAIFYDYDVYGNVKEIVRRINSDVLIAKKQDAKKTQYKYDLISGNVNKVIYQKGQPDQFIHKYEYDADNRIVNVQTSKNGTIWEKDASYNYYDHGPLARTILGEQQVQGIDYAYTLQGWLKVVNSEWTHRNNDMGLDSKTHPAYTNGNVAKDAFGYSLSYFDGDYKPRIIRDNLHQKKSPLSFTMGNSNVPHNPKDLYNGNIKTMVTSFLSQREAIKKPRFNNYKYDMLNRISSFQAYKMNKNGTHKKAEFAKYKYDRNGNLLFLNRKAIKKGKPVFMDKLVYHYKNSTNQLNIVNDGVRNKSKFNRDIDNHTHNYVYDEIGQLIKDVDEKLDQITWTVSGKVATIKKHNGDLIRFTYDALGNRLAKSLKHNNKTTTSYYIRDAQGNVMSVYELIQRPNSSEFKLKEQNIYGSSRIGLQKENLVLDQNSASTTTTSTNASALKFDTTYEAEWSDEHPFTFKDGEHFSFKTKIKLTNPSTDYYYKSIAQFDHEDENDATILYQLLVGTYAKDENDAAYFSPSFAFRKQVSNDAYHDTEFMLTESLPNYLTEMDIDFTVTIIDKENNIYDAKLTLNGKTYTLGNGLKILNGTGPLTFNHWAANDRLTWNLYFPLESEINHLSYNINGVYHNFLFNEGTGVPFATDGLSMGIKPDNNNWLKRPANNYKRYIGDKRFELSNHLGNVLSVISDKKLKKGSTFAPDVLSYNDYYPFGMLMPTRNYHSPVYRYGFNGKEKDDEIKGNNNSYDFGARVYDPRVGRWSSIDSKFRKKPGIAPYQFAANSPIMFVDPDGNDEFWYNLFTKQWTYKPALGPNKYFIDSPGLDHPFEVFPTILGSPGWKSHQLSTIIGTIRIQQDAQESIATSGSSELFELIELTDPNLAKDLRTIHAFHNLNEALVDLADNLSLLAEGVGIIKIFKGSTLSKLVALKSFKNVKSLRKVLFDKGIDIQLKFKKSWSANQKAAALKKVEQLTKGKTKVVKNLPKRASDTRGRFKKAGNTIDSSKDVDHIIELQLGGKDVLENLQALDMSVNRSIGRQIQLIIKDLPNGTKINKITIID